MALKVRLCLCLLLAFAMLSSARNFISLSGNNNIDEVVGRSLMGVSVDDYGEPSANRGHDPSRNKGGGGGGRKS
ncbi:protein PSY3-like [Mangifera indica]|uniref:protein PSY3-like n=1 Tax=Mangifera indica TaxID=29780 RepID=UPI001CFA8BA6|nr:protein PSY3-like [Mangifera indica]